MVGDFWNFTISLPWAMSSKPSPLSVPSMCKIFIFLPPLPPAEPCHGRWIVAHTVIALRAILVTLNQLRENATKVWFERCCDSAALWELEGHYAGSSWSISACSRPNTLNINWNCYFCSQTAKWLFENVVIFPLCIFIGVLRAEYDNDFPPFLFSSSPRSKGKEGKEAATLNNARRKSKACW